MVDDEGEPSSIARKIECTDPPVVSYERCNPKHPWFESNTVFEYFLGLESGGQEITEEEANKILVSWKQNWPQSKRVD